MRKRTIALIILGAGVVGGLVGYFASIYFGYHLPIVVEHGESYNILRDVMTISIAILSILVAIFIVIGTLLIRILLERDIQEKIQDQERLISSKIDEEVNICIAKLQTVMACLWGQLYEHFLESDYIHYAGEAAKHALDAAMQLDESKHWELRLMAINNHLMSLAAECDPQNTKESHTLIATLEELLKRHDLEISTINKQEYQETILYTRWRLPRPQSDDQEKAKQEFEKLKGHPDFDVWQRRWQKSKPNKASNQ